MTSPSLFPSVISPCSISLLTLPRFSYLPLLRQVPEGYFVPFLPRRAFGVVNGVSRPPHGHGSFYNHRTPGLVDVLNSPAYGFLFSGYRRFQPRNEPPMDAVPSEFLEDSSPLQHQEDSSLLQPTMYETEPSQLFPGDFSRPHPQRDDTGPPQSQGDNLGTPQLEQT